MRRLYTFLLTLMLPGIFLRLWIKSLWLPAYRKRWLERLGLPPFPPLEKVLWIHAVSVGEALSAVPLVHRLQAQFPTYPILITTMTPTGSDRIQAAFKDKLGKMLYHSYLPYDLPWVWHFFFKRIKPALLIIMETELWPNLLHACAGQSIPILIANGRLSPRSSQRYQWISKSLRLLVEPIRAVAAQSALDAQRFAALGIEKERIWEIGNIKFDLELPSYLKEAGSELRAELGKERAVWIAASTHEGEETLILEAYRSLKKRYPSLLLVLVPRHPDRFNKVAQLCNEKKLHLIRRSEKRGCTPQTDVFLGDTMGELPLLYAASDVALVGGSLVAVGGHNLLEPAALGMPILTGPYLFNFLAISQLLQKAQALIVIKDQNMLEKELATLLSDETLQRQWGERAQQVVEENRGALNHLLRLIISVIHSPSTPPSFFKA